MKKVFLALTVVLLAASCKVDSKNKVETSESKKVEVVEISEVFTVEVNSSTVNWKGYKPTGEHFGTIGISEGTLNLKDGKLIGGTFTFDMNSIKVTDMPADNEYNAKLVGHLKSGDFFDVEQFSTASFEITSVTEAEEKLNVSGNLTAKGISKNITIPAILTNDNGVLTLTSDAFKVDRTEFGIQYKSTKLVDVIKEKSIDDLFEMTFKVKASK